MKKSLLVLVLAFVTCFAAIALDAKVVSVSGKVEVQDGENWVAVKVGDILKKGDVLSTGFKSSAVLQINETNVNIGALTRMTVQQLASNDVKDETSLFLDSGKISANVQHNEKRVSFKVTTPAVTASVRGTILTVLGHNTVTSSQNTVTVTPSDQTAPVIAGTITQTVESRTVLTGLEGTPVLAGQTSNADPYSGVPSSPQGEMKRDTQTAAITTLSSQEGEKGTVATIAAETVPTVETLPESPIDISVDW